MDATDIFWLLLVGSLCAVLFMATIVWIQWLQIRQQRTELSVLRELLQGLGAVIQRLEKDRAELAAGLRAEKGQVEVLKRRLASCSG